jgi:alkyl sulfatase BDS1-like metallo-beta-lactamase superfamily hydrolase
MRIATADYTKALSRILAGLFLMVVAPVGAQSPQQQRIDSPVNILRQGLDRTKAVKINEAIFQAVGFGNSFMVTTSEGNVIIDTSNPIAAPHHVKLLKAENSGTIKYIILTHGHGDHTGGVHLWKGPETKIIAQRSQVEFLNYQARLGNFFAIRNAAQFSLPAPSAPPWPGNYGAKIDANILFDDKYEFTLGGIKFEIFSTPGETPDHLTVWIPQYKAAFCGDNYYESFPNMYTLRGTEPRWALDYVNSLNKVMALGPEILLPSHGPAVIGGPAIKRTLTRYRDAIVYVHDAVVQGMNAGKDVFSLMHEIKLPPELDVGEGYGKLTWSIRGIYEGYAGWFDMDPAAMYEVPVSSVYADIARLAGGPDAVAKLAMERVAAGRAVEALHLTRIALAANPDNAAALDARLKALVYLRDHSQNTNERGWLNYSISGMKK